MNSKYDALSEKEKAQYHELTKDGRLLKWAKESSARSNYFDFATLFKVEKREKGWCIAKENEVFGNLYLDNKRIIEAIHWALAQNYGR